MSSGKVVVTMVWRSLLAAALCLGIGVSVLPAPAQGPGVAGTVPEVEPAPDQWIAALPSDAHVPVWGWTEYRQAQWVVWPSAEYVGARQPFKDRRRQFPAVYPHGDRRLPPLGEGACSAHRARFSCLAWLRLVLRTEYVPESVAASLVLLQEQDPRQSWAAARYEVNGVAIQAVLRKWAMCLVIRPDPALIEGLQPMDIGPAVFRSMFTNGDARAGRDTAPVTGLPDGLHGFISEGDAGIPPSLWYTDGRAVAVYTGWWTIRSPRPPKPTDIWF